ncbi:MAG: UvrB/UvrC motif-containing protein [Muribaculaceae bacterium]|nr:UvrB/UvrC motif-containing protein [Muribaculaceae bacterium]
MSRQELERNITHMRNDMVKAAKNMEFMEAARLRDEILKAEQYLKEKFDAKAAD